MAAEGMPDRPALGEGPRARTFVELANRIRRVGAWLQTTPGERVVLVDLNSEAVPLSLFGAALAGKPFVPVNYRLTDEQLRGIVARTVPSTVIVGPGVAERLGTIEGTMVLERSALLAVADDESRDQADGWSGDPDDIAVLLFTSGTTGEPKAAMLRHRNLAAYIVSTVEFAGAAEDEAAIVSVPPYHIAGISAVLSSVYGGRRVVYLESFEPAEWVRIVRAERITHAMVVPTMLSRILDVIESRWRGTPVASCVVVRRRPDARCRSSSGRWRSFPASASSTPTGSPRPPRPSRCSAPTTIERRSRATTRSSGPARFGRPAVALHRGVDPRSVRRCRSGPASGARSGSGAIR